DVVGVAAATVEVDYVRQRRLATIVEVRRRQPDVAQGGRLEGAHVDGRATLRERNPALPGRAAAEILGGRANAAVLKALIATVGVDRAALDGECPRGIGQLGAGVAPGAPLAPEEAQASPLSDRQRRCVSGQELVHGRLVGNQRRFVRLNRLTENSREL